MPTPNSKENFYEDAIAELLGLVRAYWERYSQEFEKKLADEQEAADQSGTAEEDDDDESSVRLLDNDLEENSPYLSFLGLPQGASDVERSTRDQIAMHDADDTLIGWLAGVPLFVLVLAISEMKEHSSLGIDVHEFGTAQTKEDVIRVFLRRFGFVESRPAPQGIREIRKILIGAKDKVLEQRGDVGTVIGNGAVIGSLMESTLQILALFYGQHLMPNIFNDRVRRREDLTGDPAERKAWWSSVSADIAAASIWAVEAYLEKGNTYIAALIGILEAFENHLVSENEVRLDFVSKFGRNSVLPAIDPTENSKRLGQSGSRSFIDLLKEIKDLRNAFGHSLNQLESYQVIPPLPEVHRRVDKILQLSVSLFEEGYRQGLFPEVLLIRGISQNHRRKWQVQGINESNNVVLFPVSEDELGIFLPDCEVFCWPPDHVSSSGSVSKPKVMCRKYWRV